MEIPNWLSGKLDAKGADEISAAVERAEKHTSAEIVPMVVRGSITVGHVPWLLFFIAIPLTWVLLPLVSHFSWHTWVGEILTVVVASAFAFVFKRFATVQRILTPDEDEMASVQRRALLEFHLANLPSTEKAPGVLIFVSMLERRAVILADAAISARFDADVWDRVLEALLAEIGKGNFAGGMQEAIALVGSMLAEKFPAPTHGQEARVNELPNSLVIKD